LQIESAVAGLTQLIFQTGLAEQTPARCEAELRRKK